MPSLIHMRPMTMAASGSSSAGLDRISFAPLQPRLRASPYRSWTRSIPASSPISSPSWPASIARGPCLVPLQLTAPAYRSQGLARPRDGSQWRPSRVLQIRRPTDLCHPSKASNASRLSHILSAFYLSNAHASFGSCFRFSPTYFFPPL
uniref:Predicted protein n=1 Tax=Hordeum vulgare subsp. vulgare TaxID=112509 RepID=F2DCV0_HORVV|nr:predicted protein [Hordeum vulgare subsp. vulgare]